MEDGELVLTRPSPGRILRLAFKAPLVLYRLWLGWLLGERFVLLTHIGRRTGRTRTLAGPRAPDPPADAGRGDDRCLPA